MLAICDPFLLLLLFSLSHSVIKRQQRLWRHALRLFGTLASVVVGVALLVAFPPAFALAVQVGAGAVAAWLLYQLFKTGMAGLHTLRTVRLRRLFQPDAWRAWWGRNEHDAPAHAPQATRRPVIAVLADAWQQMSLPVWGALFLPGFHYFHAGEQQRGTAFLALWLSLVAYGLLRWHAAPDVGQLYLLTALAVHVLSVLYAESVWRVVETLCHGTFEADSSTGLVGDHGASVAPTLGKHAQCAAPRGKSGSQAPSPRPSS